MAATGSDVKKEEKKKEESVVESSNEQKSSSVAAAASLTKDALMIRHRIVSHTTNFEAVQSILNDGVQLKSNSTNRFDCQTFYVAEDGNSIHAVSGKYTLTFGMSNKTKIYDIAESKIKGYGSSAFSAGNEFTEAVRNDGYDAIKYKNSYKGSNFAIIRNPHYLTITGVYPTPAGTQPARLASGTSRPVVMTSRGFTQARPTSVTTSSVPLPDTAISVSTIKTIQVLGAVGTGYALYHAGRLVAASDDPYVEAQHQAILWTAASQGGMAAGRAAIPLCALVGKAFLPAAPILVPACIAGFSAIGGTITAIVAEVTWQTIDRTLNAPGDNRPKKVTSISTNLNDSVQLKCTVTTLGNESNSANIGKCTIEKRASDGAQASRLLAPGNTVRLLHDRLQDIVTQPYLQNEKEREQRKRLAEAGGVLGIITEGLRAPYAKEKQARNKTSSLVAAPLENQDENQNSNDFIPHVGFDMGKFKDDRGQTVYRGDARGPAEIFKEGFQREVTVADVIAHIEASEGGYISTSLSKVVAEGYPAVSDIPDGASRTYIYEIRTTKPGINVAEALAKHDPNHLDIPDFLESKEIAFPENIQSREVKGCWEADVMKTRGEWEHAEKFRLRGYSEEWIAQMSTDYERIVKEEFIPNPKYKPQGIFAWNNARLMGHGLLAIGATLDGIHLYGEYQQSKLTGNYDNTYREINRIAGGWTGAYVMGTWFAGKTALYTSLFSPLVQTTCTFTAGLIGSGLGYWGFGEAFMKLYDVRNTQPAMMVKSTKVVSTEGLTCTIVETEHARIAKCVVDSNLQQAIQTSQPSANLSQLSQSSKRTDNVIDSTANLEPEASEVNPSINSDVQHSSSSSRFDKKIQDIVTQPYPQNEKETKQRERLNKEGGVQALLENTVRLGLAAEGKLGLDKVKAYDLLPYGSAARLFHDKAREIASRPNPQNAQEREQRDRLDKAGGVLGVITEGLKAHQAKENLARGKEQAARERLDKAGGVLGLMSEGLKAQQQKEQQKKAAEQKLAEANIRAKALNSAQARTPVCLIPLAKNNAAQTVFKPYSYSYYNMPVYTTFNHTSQIRSMLLGYNISYSDRMRIERECSYMNLQMTNGYSYLSGLSGFHNALSMTGLISSYNSYNIYSMVRDAINSYGQIGGVASEVAIIADLIDSEAHAKAEEYFFCFQKAEFSFPLQMINQLQRELAEGYFQHKTLPFFSLHFNNDGFLYPVIHPFYQGTLVGEIIAFLDYWMKGFLNGGVFDLEFLKKWSEIPNCDEEHLRAHLIDLKKYCKEQNQNMQYFSLRELESRYGLEKQGKSAAYTQPFMTSFRIIAYQAQIQRHGNILVPNPTFKVEYSIDLMPDYKEYLEQYHKTHGDYPKDYAHTKECYERFAEEVKHKMPQLPFCRDFFQLLGVMNTFCYAYATFEKMGKRPVFADENTRITYHVPKAFPPLPVRYFRTYPVTITLGQLLKQFTAADIEAMNVVLFNFFTDINVEQLPVALIQKLRAALIELVKKELNQYLQPNEVFECNEAEIERITKRAENDIHMTLIQAHAMMTRVLLTLLKPCGASALQQIKPLPLTQKIAVAQKILDTHLISVKSKWGQADELNEVEILQAFAVQWHPTVREAFEEIDKRITEKTQQMILICKYVCGTISAEEQAALIFPLTEMQQKERENLEEVIQTTAATIEGSAAEGILHLTTQLDQLLQIEQTLQQNITFCLQEISRLQQLRASELAKIPPHLHALNAQNIANFVTPLDQRVVELSNALATAQENLPVIQAEVQEYQNNIASIPNKKDVALVEAKKSICAKGIQIYQENDTQNKKETRKALAISLLEEAHKKTAIRLHFFTEQLSHFVTTLSDNEALAGHCVAKQYTHTFMTFTGSKLNENFKISGGCGMALSNLHSKPIEHAEAFSLALGDAIIDKQDKSAEFSFNHQNYIALRLPVAEIHNTPKPSIRTEAQDILLDVMIGRISADAIPEDSVKMSLDPAHASMIHYAAATLDAQAFDTVSAKLPGNPSMISDNLGNTPLHFAALEGNVAVVSSILSKHPNLVEIKNHQGTTPLIFAIQKNHLDVVKVLISFNADAKYRLPNGLFPLYIALQENVPEITLWLLDNVPTLNLNEELDSKMTALHLAIEIGDVETAKKLIQKSASCTVKRKSDGFTPLHCAIQKGHVELARLMQSQGVSLTTALESGKTSLHIAAESGQLSCLEYLIGQGADAEAKTLDGDTALMRAIITGHFEEAKVLARVATVNQVNAQQQTASLLALQYGLPTIGDILIARGENPNSVDKKGYNYVYYLARNGEAQRFEYLLAHQKINCAQKFQGSNVLELAAKFGQFLIVYDLLELTDLRFQQGHLTLIECAIMADEIGYIRDDLDDLTDAEIASLTMIAAEYGSMCCLAWLLKIGDRDFLDFKKLLKNALEHSNNITVIELILKYCDVNAPLDAKDNTALHLATAYGLLPVIELLLNSGSNVSIRNAEQHTAFHIALLQEDHVVLKRLFKRTKASEWPVDLWQTPVKKPTPVLIRTLHLYRKRLPNEIHMDLSLPQKNVSELPTLLLDEELKTGLIALPLLFKRAQFDEAAELLEERPALCKLFQSKQGAILFQALFGSLSDPSKLLASLDADETKELSLQLSPDRLLTLLKAQGINPALYTGEHNVLLTMMSDDLDEENALYRLSILTKYFPESLATLAMDKVGGQIRVVELALKLNKLVLFKALVGVCAQNVLPDTPTFYGLHEAIQSNNYDLVKSLLKDHAVDGLNEKKQTPLMVAAVMDNVRIMELLLEAGANPEKVDLFGQNALHHALHEKAESAALCILPLLRQKNQPDRDGITPLMYAAAKGTLTVLGYLCEQADYTQSFDKKGWNALHHAAFEGRATSIALLVKQGFSANVAENPHSPKKSEKSLRRTPLHLAALKGHVEATRKLVELGADIEQEDSQHRSMYEYAVLSKNAEMLPLVETHPVYHNREKQVLLACAAGDNEEALCSLILKDISLNGASKSGATPLHLAAQHNAGDVASRLLQGGDIALDVTDQTTHTPLQYAAFYGHVRPLELLCQAGADINYRSSTTATALFLACEQGQEGAVAVLLKYKADFSIPNKEGIAPAQIALLSGHVHIARTLQLAGDKSLEAESLQQLPAAIKEKIQRPYQEFLRKNADKPISIADALIRHGIYRIAPQLPVNSINIAPIPSSLTLGK